MTEGTMLNRRMTSLDASFLYLEQPNTFLHLAGIYFLARPINYDTLLSHVRERLHLVPRYTQRAFMVPFNLGHPTWEPDPKFDLRHHLKRHILKAPGNDASLASLCARLFAERLDRTKPLWEMHLIEGYRGKGAAILAKTHHCMIDGASGADVTGILMDPTPKPTAVQPPLLPLPRPPLPGLFNQLVTAIADTARTQLEIGRTAAGLLAQPSRAIEEARATGEAIASLARSLLDEVPSTPFNGPLSSERRLAWVPLPLNEVRAIRSRLGGTVNDVVLAVISGGLRHYLRGLGFRVERTELKAQVTVSTRTEYEHLKLGNRFSMMIAPLAIGITDPVERLRQVSAAMDELRSADQASRVERLVALSDILPPVLQKRLAQLQASIPPVNTVCTNVPGPRETRYLLGEPVQMIVPIVPLGAGTGLGFAIMSYADQFTIGLNGDAELMTDMHKLVAALRRSFDELWAATGLERVVEPPKVEPALKRRRRTRA